MSGSRGWGQLLITTIGSFGCQGCDLNISLTAITLLMNIADFFSRERHALLSAFSEVGFHPGRSISHEPNDNDAAHPPGGSPGSSPVNQCEPVCVREVSLCEPV